MATDAAPAAVAFAARNGGCVASAANLIGARSVLSAIGTADTRAAATGLAARTRPPASAAIVFITANVFAGATATGIATRAIVAAASAVAFVRLLIDARPAATRISAGACVPAASAIGAAAGRIHAGSRATGVAACANVATASTIVLVGLKVLAAIAAALGSGSTRRTGAGARAVAVIG